MKKISFLAILIIASIIFCSCRKEKKNVINIKRLKELLTKEASNKNFCASFTVTDRIDGEGYVLCDDYDKSLIKNLEIDSNGNFIQATSRNLITDKYFYSTDPDSYQSVELSCYFIKMIDADLEQCEILKQYEKLFVQNFINEEEIPIIISNTMRPKNKDGRNYYLDFRNLTIEIGSMYCKLLIDNPVTGISIVTLSTDLK